MRSLPNEKDTIRYFSKIKILSDIEKFAIITEILTYDLYRVLMIAAVCLPYLQVWILLGVPIKFQVLLQGWEWRNRLGALSCPSRIFKEESLRGV